MSPEGPKTETDKKMEGHFNGIVMSMLAVLAVVLLLAVFFFFKRGASAVPSNSQQTPAATSPGAK